MNGLRNFMNGRYGVDRLSFALVILSFVLVLILRFVPVPYLPLAGYIPLVYAGFRIVSKKLSARRHENDIFERYYFPVAHKIKTWFERLKQSQTHKFYRCPQCRQQLRVPRGRGKIEITCPKCRNAFIKKT